MLGVTAGAVAGLCRWRTASPTVANSFGKAQRDRADQPSRWIGSSNKGVGA